MRGPDTFSEALFSVKKLDGSVPASHPLRAIRGMCNEALEKLEDLFAGMYENAAKAAVPALPRSCCCARWCCRCCTRFARSGC